jgi:hypothetical protein
LIANKSVPLPVRETPGRAGGAARTTDRNRLKPYTFRVVSVLVGFTVALLLCEVALRAAGWSSPGLYVEGRGPITLRNPGRDGGAFPPGVHGELRHYDYSVEWIVNSYGFRDSELVPKGSGEWRIGILGDSFTAGIGVKQPERFADIFGAEIRRQRPNATVWNLGAPLCGTACEAEMLDRLSGDYQLDEIVLAFYGGNDVEDNTAWYANIASPSSPTDDRTFWMRSKDWLREHSRLSTFVWVNSLRARATFKPPGIYSQPDLDRAWPNTERSLERLRAVIGEKKFMILYLPATPEWNDAVWQEMRTRYRTSDGDRHLVRGALANWAREHRVALVDATDWLSKCESLKSCVLPIDGHWNARGHFLVAQGLLSLPDWAGRR